MLSADKKIQARLVWIQIYQKIGHVNRTCQRCGISPPTLRLWIKRYRAEGIEGLRDKSRRPHHSPAKKVFFPQEQLILKIRKEKRFGAHRIQIELIRHHGLKLSKNPIHRVLVRHHVNCTLRKARRNRGFIRYEKEIPGERVRLDVFKVAPGLYQYTAIDDCTRYRVLDLQPRKNHQTTLRFLKKVIETMPFPIQRVQTVVEGSF